MVYKNLLIRAKRLTINKFKYFIKKFVANTTKLLHNHISNKNFDMTINSVTECWCKKTK